MGPPARPTTRPVSHQGPAPQGQPPRPGSTRRPPGRGKSRTLRVLVLLIFGALTLCAFFGFAAVVGAAFVYSDGLPPPTELETIVFPEDTVIYARDGQTVLARITSGGERRRVIEWEDVPPILADAVTAVEDKTFWANTGIDPLGIASAALDTLTGDARGGSTITQQLVRQKLLPDDVMQDSGRLGERKIKELIQSVRVTDAYRGREGKQAILTAYLNQNFYGNNSYGVQAAAKSYFGIADLDDLTIAQAATLAAIPQAPSTYDLVRNAIETDDGRLIVPADSAIVARRNLVLDLLANDPTRRELTGGTYSTEDFEAAKAEELVLSPQGQPAWRAPHFVWFVREELRQRLCGEAESCDVLDQGGLRVVTTLDWGIQQKGEKWIQAATLVPHRADPAAAAEALGVPYEPWMARLRGQNIWNGALSAIDYERGEIIAYVGSANYYERRRTSRKMQPQFDVLSSGWRQPGSAFKPFNYATGIDEGSLTAATMLMDVTTDFGGGYTPTDFNGQERGPVRVRNALQFSLNIPAVKALGIVGENDVFERSKAFGMEFQRRRPTAGLSMALGTLEVHPLDLNESYATIANGGRNIEPTSILSVTDMAGTEVLPAYEPPRGERVVSEQAAYVVTDILAGNTDPAVNPVWAVNRVTARDGTRRPAALKTGTTNDAKDLNAYGYIAPPSAQGRKQGEYALTVGVWAGNSDSSPVTTVANPVFSLDVAAPVWDEFLTDVTRGWEVRDFRAPDGLARASVDAFTGYTPSPWSRRQASELFLRGTAPGEDPYLRGVEVVRGADGGQYLWEPGCQGQPRSRGFLDLDDAEAGFPSWNEAVQGWVQRARRGAGVGADVSPAKRTYTAYFFEPYFQPYGQTWGGPFVPTRSCLDAPAGTPPPEAPSAPPVTATQPPIPEVTVLPGPPEQPQQPEQPPQEPEQPQQPSSRHRNPSSRRQSPSPRPCHCHLPSPPLSHRHHRSHPSSW